MNVIKKVDKFNFQKLKMDATSEDPAVRKNIFIEYFERFEEFPSYLFDNSQGIDKLLFDTIQDLTNDSKTSDNMQKGITILMSRLSSPR
ncbi:MAG: hypothetical protein G01um10148_268 [Parcubacteria group bacterium Gr01-1014_8]|nr:MAG: hypothetical protein G01um10148_268 [Parcubacteria group bacterium Gr01-1014_8]